LKIPVCEPSLGPKELEYVADCVKTNWISSKGKYVTEFEERFSAFCGAKYGVSTSSGTTAIHLALATLGVGRGDEVVLPTLTHCCCANMVVLTGARPILVDSEDETWNIDVDKIVEKLTGRTKVIMPVHLYGHPADMDPILDLAEDRDLCVVADSAEAHGAEYKGQRVGGMGDLECFSFYANKIITTGEGGMIVTNNQELAEKAAMLRDQAYEKERRFLHRVIGFNYRMTNLQAAIGVAQMEKIDRFIEARRRNAHLYNSLLEQVEGIKLPPETEWAKNVYWMYSILVEDSFGLSRDELASYLKERGVETRPFFYPIHLQPIYAENYQWGSCPVAEELSQQGMNLPSAATLGRKEIEYVTSCLSAAKRR